MYLQLERQAIRFVSCFVVSACCEIEGVTVGEFGDMTKRREVVHERGGSRLFPLSAFSLFRRVIRSQVLLVRAFGKTKWPKEF